MKTVFTNAMCAHVWAQQNQPEGKANSMSFRGRVMFSWATPVAMFHQTRAGLVCLITTNTYSPSTSSKCMPCVRSAVAELAFFVPWVGYEGSGRGRDDSEPSHKANLEYLIGAYHGIAERAAKRRTRGDFANLLQELESAATTARAYAHAFKLRMRKLDPGALNNKVISDREAFDTPEAKAKRAKTAAKKKAADAIKAQHEQKERQLRQYDWRHNRPRVDAEPRDRFDEARGVLLRIVGDTVETSLGARVSLAEARSLLNFVKRKHVPGRDYTVFPSVNGSRVGPFTLEMIYADGSVQIGCHKINVSEIVWFEAFLKVRIAQECAA